MTGAPILIAAYSGRALAQSARRAGFVPLVADAFGDRDTRAAAAAVRTVPLVAGRFRGPTLLRALDELAASVPDRPAGLVAGAGFEATPRLLAHLAGRYQHIGNRAETVARTKDPATFFGLLRDLGIRHPETRLDAPSDPEGWLMKEVGGSGGGHVVPCPSDAAQRRRVYFQRRVDGEAISLLGILGARGHIFAASRQWTSPTPRHPYRYGGACGSVILPADLEARLIADAVDVARALGLAGLVSFDFLVSDGEALMLEVNPRPGATLDVLDDANGTLFAAHLEACRPEGDPAALVARSWRPADARAAAYLYADPDALKIDEFDWPEWTADRPTAGTRIPRHAPVATVLARGADPATAERICRSRLETLSQLLYQNSAFEKEPH